MPAICSAARSAIDPLLDEMAGECWRGWVALGAPASGGSASTIVDVEALILLSLLLRERNRRLLDHLEWWACVGARFTSLQRLRNLARHYAVDLGGFAEAAARHGDPRWKKLATERWPSRDREQPPLMLAAPQSLMVQLRAGCGVGAKADVLALLLGLRGDWMRVRDIALSLSYSERAVRDAADDLALSRFAQRMEDVTPAEYSASPGSWMDALELSDIPPWAHWDALGRLVSALAEWARTAGDASDYVVSSELRSIVLEHQRAFIWNRIPLPDHRRCPGAEYLACFEQTIEWLRQWLGHGRL